MEHLGLAKKVDLIIFLVFLEKNLFLLVNFVIQGPTKKEDCFHFSTNFSTIYPCKNKQFFLNDTYENWVQILREGEEI